MIDQDSSQGIQQQIEQAAATHTELEVCAGNSKRFYGRKVSAKVLNVSEHTGIVNYEPTELVITVRAGTPLKMIEDVLAKENQMLAFEPPGYGDSATVGGTIACNLSGPRRAFAGAARDFVLGCHIINGKAERLHFGGEVMKNVAGYDVSRLMCGAMGTLGVLLDVSIKVLPKPETEITLVHESKLTASLEKVHQLIGQSLPMSATCFDEKKLYLRLSGSEVAVQAARKLIGGELLHTNVNFWQQLKEHKTDFFSHQTNLWRLSLASNSPLLDIKGTTLYEWNGALRWLVTAEKEEIIREKVSRHGGHAICFRQYTHCKSVFHPLPNGLLTMHQQLKQAFDPDAMINPGRMYAGV